MQNQALRTVPNWARLSLFLTAPLLLLSLLVFLYEDSTRLAGLVAILASAAEAGLLEGAEAQQHLQKAIIGTISLTLLVGSIVLVVGLNLVVAWRCKLGPVSCQSTSQALPSENLLSRSDGYELNENSANSLPTQLFPGSTICTFDEQNTDWKESAYPLKLVTIQAQGTKHTTREAMIQQLEQALDLVANGSSVGEHHDDDFGYRFELSENMDRTIFASPAARTAP